MDVNELMRYDAAKGGQEKNSRKKSESASEPVPQKKVKTTPVELLSDKEKLEVLKALEDDTEVENFDESSLKKLLNQFEKKVVKNQEMRIKYSDAPEKFMESEIELNDIIQEMQVIGTRPELYPVLLQSHGIQLLLSLLSHENSDISASVLGLLQELTDIDSSLDSIENVKNLIDVLCEQQIFQLLVPNLERFDEKNKDEADAVHNALNIIENIVEIKRKLDFDESKQALLQWLIKRIKIKGHFSTNKLYAAEVLAILAQNSDENRKLIGDLGGIDIFLQQIAYYKKNTPTLTEEKEYMENLFDNLCSSLMLPSNRTKFLEGEGLQLMRLIIRDQKHARNSALKVLSYAMTTLEGGKENCEAFVEMLGLAVLFPLFMKPTSGSKRKNNYSNEEHIISIVSSLLRNCSGLNKQRVLHKFVENDFEKTDRLLELFFKYSEQVDIDEPEFSDSDEEDQYYMKKLDCGLFALQLIVYTVLELCANGSDTTKSRIMKLLNLRKVPKEKLISIMKYYAANLGDDDIEEDRIDEEKAYIQKLIEKF